MSTIKKAIYVDKNEHGIKVECPPPPDAIGDFVDLNVFLQFCQFRPKYPTQKLSK